MSLQDGSDDDGGDSEQTGKVAEDDWADWRSHSVEVRGSLEMPDNLAPWTSKEVVKLTGVKGGPRFVDVIDVAYFSYLKQCKNGIPKIPRLCCDISQGVERRHWWAEPNTLTQGSLLYVFPLDRVLDAEDCVRSSAVGF
jgi:hypothetical protein